ncbi:hypothetical protein ACFLT2_13915 [Acidobacteriota bacterium]
MESSTKMNVDFCVWRLTQIDTLDHFNYAYMHSFFPDYQKRTIPIIAGGRHV